MKNFKPKAITRTEDNCRKCKPSKCEYGTREITKRIALISGREKKTRIYDGFKTAEIGFWVLINILKRFCIVFKRYKTFTIYYIKCISQNK